MSINREVTIKKCTELLLNLAVEIEHRNSMFLFDAAKLSEDIYCLLLNGIYDLNLKNLNQIKVNFPAIDLGDSSRRICYQITSGLDQSKVDDTCTKFLNHKLNEQFDELRILSISTATPHVRATTPIPSVKIEIVGLKNIIKDLGNLRDLDLQLMSDFLESELHSKEIPNEGFKKYRFKKYVPRKLEIQTYEKTFLIDDLFRSRPIAGALDKLVRDLISNLLMEVAENIFKHKHDIEPTVSVELDKDRIKLCHSGREYNPKRMLHEKGRQGEGTIALSRFARLLRKKHGMTYIKDHEPGIHLWEINFSFNIFDLQPYRDCVVEQNEISNVSLYGDCDVVYVVPGPDIRSTSKVTAFYDVTLRNIPSGKKPGIALQFANEHLIMRFKARYPGVPIMILETGEIT